MAVSNLVKYSVSVGRGDGTTLTFSKTSAKVPIMLSSMAIYVGPTLVAADDGSGLIVASGAVAVTGTVDYRIGAIALTFIVAPTTGAGIRAEYDSYRQQEIIEVWSDIHPGLKRAGSGDTKKLINVEAVYGSLENILLTIIGERVMRRTFAVNMKTLLFEPMLMDIIKDKIIRGFIQAIELWEPRVKSELMDVKMNPDRQELYIRMEFYIRGYDQVFLFDKVYKY